MQDRKNALGTNAFVTAMQANTLLEPVKLGDVIEEYAPTGEKVKAETLLDKEFTIIRARAFESRFESQDHAYFVTGYLEKDQKLVSTVFGGAAVVDILDAFIKAGFDRPLTVVLTLNEGGKYGQYYTLE